MGLSWIVALVGGRQPDGHWVGFLLYLSKKLVSEGWARVGHIDSPSGIVWKGLGKEGLALRV